ncbi:MAG: hypothetical protein AAB403_05955, partial [Planctomycetota bacterium]
MFGVWYTKGCPDRGREPERKEEEDASEWVRRKLGLDPDPKQALVLTSASKRGMLNCARQWGKSTIAAAKAVHEAVHRKESLVLVVSGGDRQVCPQGTHWSVPPGGRAGSLCGRRRDSRGG